jgi:UDP-N-acetylglucosamine 2-epimerase (non-hydrolysing)
MLRNVSAPSIVVILGNRPQFVKHAAIARAWAHADTDVRQVIVDTGQHYDHALNGIFVDELAIPEPDYRLGVGSASHAEQLARMLPPIEEILLREKPASVLLYGDTNSTLGGALVASKLHIPIAHVEAGLRSFDRDMPEEINRVLTDQIAELLYTTERDATDNLAREGIDTSRIHFVGNVMIDSLLAHRARATPPAQTLAAAGVDPARYLGERGFGVVTLHRPSNVDSPDALDESMALVCDAAARLPLVWPLHPRTRANLERFGFMQRLAAAPIALLEPQGYLEMLGLLASAAVVLTDSGGIQEETTALAVPCLTMRENTERPITVTQGTNTLVGRDRAKATAAVADILAHGGKRGRVPELWDGRAAERIAGHLVAWLGDRDGMAAGRGAHESDAREGLRVAKAGR